MGVECEQMAHRHDWQFEPRYSANKMKRYSCACGRWAWRTIDKYGIGPLHVYAVNSDSLKHAMELHDRIENAPWGADYMAARARRRFV